MTTHVQPLLACSPLLSKELLAGVRRIQPNLSLEMMQRGLGVLLSEIDAQRSAALRQAGLE